MRLGQSFHSLSFVPIYVARDLTFKEEGIEIDWQLASGTLTAKALLSGEVDFGVDSSTNALSLVGTDQPTVVIACITHELTQGLIVTKQFAESRRLTREQPIADRVHAFKGAVVAVNSVGGSPDRYFRWLLRKHQVDPEQDLRIIAISGNAAQLSALQVDQVQGVFSAPPIGEELEYEGKGFFLIWMPKDEPRMRDFVYEVVSTRRDFAQKNPDVVRRVARAIARANDYVNDHPAETKEILAKYFDSTPKPIIDLVMDTSLKTAFGRGARMSVEQWRNVHDISLEAGALDKPVDVTEGRFWTNDYLDSASRA